MKSKRSKKRNIHQGMLELRAKPGWDPHPSQCPSPLDQLRELNQAQRNQAAYDTSGPPCDTCLDIRQKNNDKTALCESHLQQALGL